VPFLPPPAVSLPTCPSILVLLLPSSFPISAGQRVERIGASSVAVSVGVLCVASCDVT
jgi:hypothetical protein